MNKFLLLVFLVLTIYVAISSFASESFASAPVVEYHYTEWCPFCKVATPIVDAVAASLPGVKFIKHDESVSVTDYVSGVPQVYIVLNGKRQKYPGRIEYNSLREWIVTRR